MLIHANDIQLFLLLDLQKDESFDEDLASSLLCTWMKQSQFEIILQLSFVVWDNSPWSMITNESLLSDDNTDDQDNDNLQFSKHFTCLKFVFL